MHPTLVFEAGRSFAAGDALRLRPFVEGRWGAETLIRAGADLVIGQVGQGELLVRDPVSGQRYRAIQNDWQGYALVLGADIAHVSDSVFLPGGAGYEINDTRERVRAGLHWQGEKSSAFYGVTWLSEEFSGQDRGQVVGSLRLDFEF